MSELAPIDGVAYGLQFVGTHEPFYLNDGTKAYLVAVREEDETVGFRALVLEANYSAMFELTDPAIDFEILHPEVLNFSAGTTYVKYLQIDNKIFALSDNGESMRIFNVGEHKEAKALFAIERPEWTNEDKLTVVHPDAAWIQVPTGKRRNRVPNPSFERSLKGWNPGALTTVSRSTTFAKNGSRSARITSAPTRMNLAQSPLFDVVTNGIPGWDLNGSVTDMGLHTSTSWLEVYTSQKGTFYAHTRVMPGIVPGEKYRFAFDYEIGSNTDLDIQVKFFGNNGVQVGKTLTSWLIGPSRYVSVPFKAPKDAVSIKLYIGGDHSATDATYVRVKNLVICQADEPTTMFSGASGANYFWTDTPNGSASVYHPPANISLTTDKVPVVSSHKLAGTAYVRAVGTGRNATVSIVLYDKRGQIVGSLLTATAADAVGSWTRILASSAGIPATATQAALSVTYSTVPRGEYHHIDSVLLEGSTDTADPYFDGDTVDTGTKVYEWLGTAHDSPSREKTYATSQSIPTAETRTVDTLIATGGPSVNVYSFGFFYTFENEVGESAASMITVRRTQRAWTDWVWETPNAAGEPSGTNTDDSALAADQLVAFMPEDVWIEAIAQGAVKWNLYMFTWSNQDVVPVTAFKVASQDMDESSLYQSKGWLQVTPQMKTSGDAAILPTVDNIYNYSTPPNAGQGLVAGDRMIVVDDPTAPAVIRWSSNQVGEYTNFTASRGGGYKTLTSGNLYVPAAVKLWQNPQSADTICILCLGTDGYSSSYYMSPAEISAQSESTQIMGFEETTATPGTTSPYGVEIFNNSLYHPIDDQLMKSTASNYNINHKSQTDQIRNMWAELKDKDKIVSSQHDGRLYYIVNNPEGEILEEGCNGNEIWVFDATAKTGTWSRFLIQAHSLRKIEFGGQIYMSVTRPEGIYYLDPDYGLDDYVNDEQTIRQRAIPWRLESNTQGANRAHDAWAHLQQMQVTLGNFLGRAKYGIRAVDSQGRLVDKSKIVRDRGAPTVLAWDIYDQLKIQRDVMEWYFYASSVTRDDGSVEPSQGQISAVQYRYTPVSVNVGYGDGSVETFQYGRDVAEIISDSTTENGIPLPLRDSRRP